MKIKKTIKMKIILLTQWLFKWFIRQRNVIVICKIEGNYMECITATLEVGTINKIFKNMQYKMRRYDEYLIENHHGDYNGNT